MSIKRLYPSIQADDPSAAKAFYGDILGMDVVMDQGWVMSFASTTQMPVQILFAKHSGAGDLMSDISIEVNDFDDILSKVQAAGLPIEYGPKEEPWGVKRFFVRDPFGKLINILTHI